MFRSSLESYKAQTANPDLRDRRPEEAQRLEKSGYQIILTVHDELICEAPDTPDWNPEHLSALLAEPPPWALDLPLAAAGFESYRYKKG